MIDSKLNENLCQYQSSYPTKSNRVKALAVLASYEEDNNDTTIVASNCSIVFKQLECAKAIAIVALHPIANTGATSTFIMKGTPVKNLRRTNNPITVSLPDRTKVSSTHICGINIPGLPTALTGHIVPGITMASLIRIRILCKAGCKVVLDDEKCKVFYNNDITLRGFKDPTTYGNYQSPKTRLQRPPKSLYQDAHKKEAQANRPSNNSAPV
jgi:hypothetical protein